MSDRPRDGIYLDAALGVIGEQIDERIDELSRRRRRRARAGIAALAMAAVASSSVAAFAITSAVQLLPQEPSTATMSTIEVHCVDGEDTLRSAYFAVRFRAAVESTGKPERVCATARNRLAADDGTIAAATPSEVVAIASEIVAAATRSTTPAAASIAVDEASFGRLSHAGGPEMTACRTDDLVIVLATPRGAPASPAERALLCARATR